MAELIRKDKLISWSYREPTYYDSINDRTDMRDFINELPTTTEAEIRAMAKRELASEIMEFVNSNNRGSADYFIVDKIEELCMEQLKERE